MRVLKLLLLVLVLFAAGGAGTEARAAGDDGCRAGGEGPLVASIRDAEHARIGGDLDRLRQILARVRRVEGVGPWILIEAGRVLAAAGDTQGGRTFFSEALRVAKQNRDQARGARQATGARLLEAAALLRVDRETEARADIQAVRGVRGSLRDHACRWIPVAQALADRGKIKEGLDLLRAVAKAAGPVRSVHDGLVELASRSGKPEVMEAALRSALDRFPGDVEFTVRLANRIKTRGRAVEARKLLEDLLLRGEESPSLLGELLGLVSGRERAKDNLPYYRDLYREHPDRPALALLVGVMLHYLGRYEESNTWLGKAGGLIDTEPRAPMYLAMNHFHLGHLAEADRYIRQAAEAGRPDPDIYYCRAVIGVRADPTAAVADLERYLELTSGRPDVDPAKQKRVRQTLDLLAGCLKTADPKACVEEQVVQEARALAFQEHYPGTRIADEEPPAEAQEAPEEPQGGTDDPAGDPAPSSGAGGDGDEVEETEGSGVGLREIALGLGIQLLIVGYFLLRPRRDEKA